MINNNYKNLLLIITDALRYDFFEVCYSSCKHTGLRKLIDNSIIFKNAYSTINATDPSLTTIFTGLYPTVIGLTQHGEKVKKEHLSQISKIDNISMVLKKQGYTTIAIDVLNRWHKRGFDIYKNANNFIFTSKKRLIYIYKKLLDFLKIKYNPLALNKYFLPYTADIATSLAIDILNKNKDNKKWFLMIHYWDTHFPYGYYCDKDTEKLEDIVNKLIRSTELVELRKYPTLEQLNRVLKGPWYNNLLYYFGENTLLLDIMKMYISSVRWTYEQISNLIDFLDEKSILENTIIIITSDHGESLGEHNIWFDHHGLYEPTIRVPFILYSHDIGKNTIEGFVQHIDLFPTIADLLKLKFFKYKYLDGLNLLEYIKNGWKVDRKYIFVEESYTERKIAIRTDKYKFIMSFDRKGAICRYCNIIHGGTKELYDLRSDPNENNNIILEKKDIAKELERLLINKYKNLLRKNLKLKLLKNKF